LKLLSHFDANNLKKKKEKKSQTVTFYVVFMKEGRRATSKPSLPRSYFTKHLINCCPRRTAKINCASLPVAGSLQTAGAI
jgi:hypothetical protein